MEYIIKQNKILELCYQSNCKYKNCVKTCSLFNTSCWLVLFRITNNLKKKDEDYTKCSKYKLVLIYENILDGN